MPGLHFCAKNLKTAGSEVAVHSHFTTHSSLQPQNHRTAEVGRDLQNDQVQPPAQAGSPKTTCPGPCPDGFGIPPRRLHKLSEQPVPVLSHHHSKNVLPSVQTATSFFPQFLALASGLTAKRLVSFTLHPLLDYLYTVIRTLLNLFF